MYPCRDVYVFAAPQTAQKTLEVVDIDTGNKL